MRIYTLGYEKRNIDDYIKILRDKEVDILIDVREIAWSYKRDFCKTKFSSALKKSGIEYFHLKELGNPKSIRKNGQSPSDILKTYKSYLTKTESGIDTLIEIINAAKKRNLNICLTCFERDHTCCHRSIIAEHINPRLSKIAFAHL